MRRGVLGALLVLASALPLAAQSRVGDLTFREGEIPVRLVGYGLVVGLDGTGDRSFGSNVGAVHTVRSVTNLLRRFNVEIPADRLRLRNVAAVLVTAEVPAYLRPGARFEVQVASVGDATSLKGGVLWMTPLLSGPDAPPIATAQGALPVATGEARTRYGSRGAASGRIADGGILEAALPPVAGDGAPRLLLRTPDLTLAARIAAAIDSAVGPGTAVAQDPGAIALTPPAGATDNLMTFLASVDTVRVTVPSASRIVIDARNGVVVAGGDVSVSDAVVSLSGLTVRVGTAPDTAAAVIPGMLALGPGTTVQDVAAGLRALGATATDVVAVFDGLRAAGAVTATVVIR
ncbi:MAG TPA: flagellar basal body P-ring protein FlgI [Gemmatimonadales bacterium]|nr:flagellar basal body P-ring protein FlgI [Gemmatimonadales bacterium]HPF62187.1 flagellar basal body P-ring protein FlgI [Gemmatimonadales bacterium]HRX19708.1 flagellar basal body P-ring protein FlgI [Gemmatimonadales bacterium]